MFSSKDIETAIEIVKKLNFPSELGCDNGYFCLDIISDELIDNGFKEEEFELHHGISKVVIIFEKFPFVIKIPFLGRWYDEYDEENNEFYSEFERFTCAPSINGDDYCEAETNTIKEMIFYGYEDIVAYEICLGIFNGVAFYIQEKVRPYNCEFHYTPSEDSLNIARNIDIDYGYCDDNWRASVIELYGEEYWRSFVEWVDDGREYILNDMHIGNYGYDYEGKPVLFDVSGFDG